MKNIVSHIRLDGFGNTEINSSYQFNISALDPFDGMKVCLEQAMYIQYLTMASISEDTLVALQKRIINEITSLKHPSEYDSTNAKTNLFEIGKKAALTICQSLGTELHFTDFTPADLFAIFNEPNAKEYVNREYTSTMNETFLIEFCSYFLGWFNKEKYLEGSLSEAALFIPSMIVVTNYDPRCNCFENKQHQEMVISLASKYTGEFDLTKPMSGHSCIFQFIKLFNLEKYTLDDLFGILASFSLSHDRYVMTNPTERPEFRIVDICFDLVTGSSFVKGYTAGNITFKDKVVFLNTVNEMVSHNHIQKIKDNELFGELLKIIGEEPNLINYFTKPITQIVSNEAYSYLHSEYLKITTDRLMASMEAIDDDAADDQPTEEEPDATDGVQDTEDTSEETTDEDTSLDDPLSDTSAEEKEDNKPQIDPKMMLLELVNPSQSMSDYVYREMVARRISYIIKNPPENAMPNDILMLKRWRSRWLYLASIACLRDFLSRVSIRLSDI